MARYSNLPEIHHCRRAHIQEVDLEKLFDQWISRLPAQGDDARGHCENCCSCCARTYPPSNPHDNQLCGCMQELTPFLRFDACNSTKSLIHSTFFQRSKNAQETRWRLHHFTIRNIQTIRQWRTNTLGLVISGKRKAEFSEDFWLVYREEKT